MKTLALSFFSSGIQRWSLGIALAISPLLVSNALAQEFQSISINAAILYDGPSANSKRLFIAPRGMPLRVVTVAEPFVKVRDMGGDVAWVERRSLGNVRTLIALATTNLRFSANDSANVVVQIERGVVVELLEAPANGFVRVKHMDGSQGFVKTSEVWGL
jgi:SH3-like domain-containing protein